MAAPKKKTGTVSPRTVPGGDGGGPSSTKGGGKGNGKANVKKGGSPNASSKGNGGGGGNKGGKKKKGGKTAFNYNMTPLNPPFDPRIRRIGSPLNRTDKIKRGWVQTEDDNQRVNFLFNPSQLDLSHQVLDSVETSQQDAQGSDDGSLENYYATIGSSTSVKLLYDRTYELFSPPATGSGKGFANRFGVWADVAAWYVLLGMLPEMPTNWDSSIITDPPQPKRAYMFIGPKMVYYGHITGLSVTYSHWSQEMVPTRCAVDIGFDILPFGGDAPLRGKVDLDGTGGGWRDDWLLNSGMDYLP